MTPARTRTFSLVVLGSCAGACGPTQPTPSDPWVPAVRVADVTDVSGPRLASPRSCLAVAGDGRALVLWSQRGSGADVLWAQQFPSGGAPSPPEPIQGPDRLARVDGLLCGLDGTGSGYASWVEYSEDRSRLLVRRVRPEVWEAGPILFEERPRAHSSDHIQHDLAVDVGGGALIAWIGADGIRSAVGTGGSWTDAGLIEARPFSGTAEIRVQVRGPLAVAAYARDYTYPEGRRGMASYARLLGPSGWGPARLLRSAQGAGVMKPTLDDKGRSTVLSWQIFFPVPLMCIDRYEGITWSGAPCNVYTSSLPDPTGAAGGDVFLLTLDRSDDTLKVMRWLPGAREAVFEVAGPGDPYSSAAGTAVSADGSHAAWISNARPWVSRALGGGSWTPEPVPGARAALPSPLACPPNLFNGTVELRLGTTARGDEVLTWVEGDCGAGTLWLQRRTRAQP